MPARLRLLLLAAFSCVTLGSAGVQADIRGARGVELSDEDLRYVERAANRLYRADAPVGSTERWENPASGNAGTVTVQRRFEDAGIPCWRTVHDVTLKNGPTYRIDAERCLVPAPAEATGGRRR
jgi:surface antigen